MAARRPFEPQIQKLNIQKLSLRTAESASSLNPPSREIAIPASDLTFSSASSPVERKKKFRLPKIVLQDKKRPDFDVKSCIEIDSQLPQDDAEIHEEELQCCPPCDPQGGKGSKYIVERSDWTPLRKAEPGDLACFLAGCPPGVSVCEKHHRQRGVTGAIPESLEDHQIKDSLQKFAHDVARNSSKGSGIPRGIKSKSILADNRGSDGYNTASRNSPLNSPSRISPSSTVLKSNSDASPNDQNRSSIVIMSPLASEQESSVTSGSDAFPHATNSMELGMGKTELLSTLVVTNFNLGGVKSKTKYTTTKEATRKRQSFTRSQGGVDIPEPRQLERNRGNRIGSVARAREGLERRSKSEGPPSFPQSLPRDTRRTWEDNTSSQLLGAPGNDPVRSMDQIFPDIEKYDDNPQITSKGRLRSMKDEARSTQTHQSIASKLSITDDTTPTEFSTRNLNSRDTRTASPETVRIRTNDSQQYLTEIGSKSQADGSGGSKSKPPSFVSSHSKALLAKHHLLKSAVTESQTLDTGLPLTPVLTSVPVASEIVVSDIPKSTETLNIISDSGKGKAIADHGDLMYSVNAINTVVVPRKYDEKDQLPQPIVKNLANIRKAQDLVDDVRGRLQKAEVQMIQAMSQEISVNKTSANMSLATYSKFEPEPLETDSSQQVTIAIETQPLQSLPSVPSTGLADSGSPRIKNLYPILLPAAKNSPAPAVESKSQGTPQGSGHPVSPAAQETLNAAYWGFVPAIKEAVQDIVEVAVRNAVNEATIATVNKKKDVRKPTVEPQEPLKKPNEQFQQVLARDIPPTSQRDSESTIIRTLPVSNLYLNTGQSKEPPVQKVLRIQNSPRESFISKCQENESNKEILTLSSIGSSTGYGQLETVPLDDSTSFVTGGKNGNTSVPPRRSSKNKVLVSKIKKPRSAEVVISSKASMVPQIVSKCPDSRGSRVLRSISSAGSLEAAPGIKNEDKEVNIPLIRQLDDETTFPMNKLSRANTVHWLKELLLNNGPYEPQFTALPPRMQKDNDKAILKTKIRSGKQPEKAGAEEYKTLPLGPVVARPKTVASRRDRRAEASEAFTQTINDLETLMNEALQIARQVADTQDAPNALSNAARILKGDRERSEEELRARYQAKLRRNDRESLPSVHESLMSFSDSEASDMTEDTEFRCPRPPTPPVTRQTATLKTEGSAAKTCSERPEVVKSSNLNSQESRMIFSDLPLESSGKSADTIKSADPRSMPLESQISDRRKEKLSLLLGSGNLAIAIETRSSSKRKPELDNYEGYSDSETVETPPEFKTLEFSRGRATTLRTLGSDRSPRRLSPVKTDVPQKEETSKDPKGALVDTSREPQLEEYSDPLPQLTPQNMSARKCDKGHSEEEYQAVATKLASKSVPGKRQVRDYILDNRRPPIQERESSRNLRQKAKQDQEEPRVLTGQTAVTGTSGKTYNWQNIDQSKVEPCPELQTKMPSARAEKSQPVYAPSYDGSNLSHEMDFNTDYAARQRDAGGEADQNQDGYELRDVPDPNLPQTSKLGLQKSHPFNLKGLNHMSLKDHHLKGFSLARSHKKQKIARDWSPARKRFVAFVSCLSTSLIGLLVGIYAGETPSIQYYIVDLHHYTVLGNVFFFIGLAIPTFFFWPLPLLHGRKPYILGSMSLAMPLLFPQALAVGQVRSPYVATWRVALIFPRAAMGLCLGFANMNFKSMLTDVFGASLQSSNPHQEHADEFDVRRHGGGMGVWLGLWTWSTLGSIGVGFMIGAMIINHLSPAWGFYISITIIAFVMLLNVLVPETRRSAYRRSVAEVPNPNGDVSRRLARGEVKMHMVQTGPKWWGEEFHYGVMLTTGMLRQPGFMVMALYVAWIYGQMVLIILLLGALMSRDYKFTSPEVAASATAIPLGALLAIPFQKASFLSRARSRSPVSDDATLSHKKVHWSSHMVRRSIFILVLPFAGLGFTLSSSGPPVPFIIPIMFAGLIGFLSNLAMAECHGILMETFDTSDLQPGMTGRARGSSGNKKEAKRTNYSSFPRVQSAFAITQGFGYLIASAASGVGGALTRHIGAQAATGVMAGILLLLSLMLLGVLVRFTTVQIVPDSRVDEMERYHNARRASRVRREEGIEEEEPFRPIIIGNPHHHTRRMCLLELGGLSRFSEIRIKNKMVDNNSLEAKHPNRAAFMSFEKKIKEKEEEIVHHLRRSLSRHSSRGSRRSDAPAEPGDLGGFREMGVETLARNRSGNARGSRRDQLRREGSTTRKGVSE